MNIIRLGKFAWLIIFVGDLLVIFMLANFVIFPVLGSLYVGNVAVVMLVLILVILHFLMC